MSDINSGVIRGSVEVPQELKADLGFPEYLLIPGGKGPKGDIGLTGPKGDPFIYEDFTPEQLSLLVGPKGDIGLQGEQGDIGPKGDPFIYEDFTPEQLSLLIGPKGDIGLQGEQGPKGDIGLTGNDGYTPVKGVDYFTEAEKQEIIVASTYDDAEIQSQLDSCFQSVSSGKVLVANAITDKGVVTPVDSTFATMASNIMDIQSGGGEPFNPFKNLTDFSYMFSGGKFLDEPQSTIDMMLYNTKNFTDLSNLFQNAYNNSRNDYLNDVVSKSFLGLNTSNVINMSYMFRNAYMFDGDFLNSNKFDLDISKVAFAHAMFDSVCKSPHTTNRSIDFSFMRCNPETSVVCSVNSSIFSYNTYLEEILNFDITKFYTTYTSTSDGFVSSSTYSTLVRLKRLTFKMNDDGTPKTMLYNGKTNYFLYNCYNLGYTDKGYGHDQMVETINTLPYTTSNSVFRLSSSMGGNLLTPEEITIATDRGWTITLK